MREPIDPLDPEAVRKRLEEHRADNERLIKIEFFGFLIAYVILAIAAANRVADWVAS